MTTMENIQNETNEEICHKIRNDYDENLCMCAPRIAIDVPQNVYLRANIVKCRKQSPTAN